MEIGEVNDKYTWMTHPTATAEILRLAKEHPDYPITVFFGENACAGDLYWTYATEVYVGIGEILDCNTEWWIYDCVCTDRDNFKECAQDMIYDKMTEELGREPTNEEQETAWKAVKDAHEPYWKKCIVIYADN